jgi:hypothetical protein
MQRVLKQQSRGFTSSRKQQVWVPAGQQTKQLLVLLVVARVPVQQQQQGAWVLLLQHSRLLRQQVGGIQRRWLAASKKRLAAADAVSEREGENAAAEAAGSGNVLKCWRHVQGLYQ